MENLTKETFIQKICDFENDSEFKTIKPTVIDFSASWCNPCKVMLPTLEYLSKQYKDIDFYKVDVEEEPEIAHAFQVRNIPLLFFISTDGSVTKSVGLIQKEKIEENLKNIL